MQPSLQNFFPSLWSLWMNKSSFFLFPLDHTHSLYRNDPKLNFHQFFVSGWIDLEMLNNEWNISMVYSKKLDIPSCLAMKLNPRPINDFSFPKREMRYAASDVSLFSPSFCISQSNWIFLRS